MFSTCRRAQVSHNSSSHASSVTFQSRLTRGSQEAHKRYASRHEAGWRDRRAGSHSDVKNILGSRRWNAVSIQV